MTKAFGAAFRNLRRSPAFTGLVVLTLALGIGAATAMFSVVDAVLLRPLPFPHADRVIEVWTYYREGASRAPTAPSALIAELRAEDRLFESISGYQFGSGTLTGVAEPESLDLAGLAPDVFTIFPAAPLAGRLFNDDDVGGDTILISERLWARHFGRDPAVIDRVVTIDDRPRRIIGVLPSRFNFPTSSYDVWRPIDVISGDVLERVMFVGLRRPDVTPAQIDERLLVLSSALVESGVLPPGQYLRHVSPVQVQTGRSSARSLYLLLGAVSMLLLVACVNVSNLLLVRASSEHSRLALMAAMGAGRSRLLGDAISQSLLLTAAGGAIGLWLASALLQAILTVMPEQLSSTWRTAGLDVRAVAFAIGVSLVTCLLFSLLPAWRASRVDPIDALKQQSRSTGSDAWQGALVSVQIALVVVLLGGAGLLLRSFVNLNAVDLGFDPDGVATLYVQLTSPQHNAPGRGLAIMREVERRVETELAIPATIVTSTPIRRGGAFGDVHPEAEGFTKSPPTVPILQAARVSPDFFDVFRIPLIEGRTFELADGDLAVIVNDVAARRFWGETSPIGRRFRVDSNMPWQTVVGVAKDVKTAGPDDRLGEGLEIYQPFAANARYNYLTLAVAAGSSAESMLPRMKRILWDVDPKVPVLEAHTLSDRLFDVLARPRFILTLAAAFTVCAVLIAAVGVYGVSAYWVARRRRELAIRIAMGATPERLVWTVVGRSLRLALVGTVAGLTIAVAGARVMTSLLFATDPRDPLTLVSITVLLGAIAVIACAGPALKAARVDPMTTLRAE